MTVAYLRQATKADLPTIEGIITEAKQYLKDQGIDQWQTAYPATSDLEKDVDDGISYVLMIDGEIAGTAALHQGLDENYMKIEDGEWLNGTNAHYTAIHRIALSNRFRGKHLSEKMVSGLITVSGVLGFTDVRIDTHPDNVGMQHVIDVNGFTRRGTIQMFNTPRFAYQFIIE